MSSNKKSNAKSGLRKKRRSNVPARLPEKLMEMLTYVEEEIVPKLEKPEDACVGWMPDGDAFVIRNEKEFTETLLPKFFKQKTMSNFVRNLYRWGFHQTQQRAKKKGDRPAVYGHETFHRGKKDCMEMMTSDAGFRRAAQLKSAIPVESYQNASITTDVVPTSSQEAENTVPDEQPSSEALQNAGAAQVVSSQGVISSSRQNDEASKDATNALSVQSTAGSTLPSLGVGDMAPTQLSQLTQAIQCASAQQQLMNNAISGFMAQQLVAQQLQQQQQQQQALLCLQAANGLSLVTVPQTSLSLQQLGGENLINAISLANLGQDVINVSPNNPSLVSSLTQAGTAPTQNHNINSQQPLQLTNAGLALLNTELARKRKRGVP